MIVSIIPKYQLIDLIILMKCAWDISFEKVEKDFDAVFESPNSDKADIVKIINKYVPDFMHIETGKHLDQKM